MLLGMASRKKKRGVIKNHCIQKLSGSEKLRITRRQSVTGE